MITKLKNFKKINENRDPGPKYGRVIPRDLFNESKLLKCMGQLCLMIHENRIPVEMTADHDGSPFQISLLFDGSLTVTNVHVSIKGTRCTFKTTYNSKSNYPMFVALGYDEYPVFNDKGEFDEEFIEFCNNL